MRNVQQDALIRALGFVVAAALVNAGPIKAQVYHNEEFGITLPLPERTHLCRMPDYQHDHGPALLLGTTDVKYCYHGDHARRIDVFASYNAVQSTKTLHDFLRAECAGLTDESCRRAPPDLYITGMRTAAGRVDYPGGSIDIIVVIQAGKPDPAFDPSVPLINYDLTLHTSPRHLADDLRVFRAVLATIRLSPADPPPR